MWSTCQSRSFVSAILLVDQPVTADALLFELDAVPYRSVVWQIDLNFRSSPRPLLGSRNKQSSPPMNVPIDPRKYL